MNRILLISHKGIIDEGDRGNTLIDFKKAQDAGVDMIEMDIRKTKDGVLVTHYEEDISGVFLKNITFETAQELAEKKGYNIPKLSKVISELSKVMFDFELKEEGYEAEFVEFLNANLPDQSRYIISSFNDRSITLIKNKDPKIKAGLRLWRKKPKEFIETRVSELFPFKRIEECGADFICLSWKLLPAGLLWRAEKRGIPVYVACIKPPSNLTPFLKNPSLKGILTDNFHEFQKVIADLK